MDIDPTVAGNGTTQPQQYNATVVGHHRLRHDLAVIRLIGEFVPFAAGQSVGVQVPQFPQLRRRFSPALPPSLDGKLEFHVRMVPSGWCSATIVADTAVGDEWVIGAPQGMFSVDPHGNNIVMIAGGTGLAPLRSQILELARWENPPATYLFFGGSCPRDLYAGDMLTLLAEQLPWLTVIPVVEDLDDPSWTDDWYEQSRVDVGFTPDDYLHGTLAEVVGSHGAFDEHQVLVCGSPTMTRSTVEQLLETGTPPEMIQFEGG